MANEKRSPARGGGAGPDTAVPGGVLAHPYYRPPAADCQALPSFSQWAANFINTLSGCPDPEFATKVIDLAQRHVSNDGDGWQARTLREAYQERPPVEYVVSGLFELPSLNVVYGAPGTLKSFLLADLAVCVAAGLEWLPPLSSDPLALPGRKTLQAPVVWCDFDNGVRRTDERFGSLGRARGVPEDAPLFYYCMPSPWLNANDSRAVDDLGDRVLRLGGKLVVIDNLGTVSGGVEENSSEMIQVMSNLRQLAERTGAAVVVIHHQRKFTGGGGRKGDNLRGHSSIEAALDLALWVEREDGGDEIAVTCTKSRGVTVPPFGAIFTYEHRAGANDLAAARFYGAASAQAREDAEIEAAILDALTTRGEPMNQSELWRALKDSGFGRNRIFDAAKRLAQRRRLKVTPGKHGALEYSIP